MRRRPSLVLTLVLALVAPLVAALPAAAGDQEPTSEPLYHAQYGPAQINVEPVWERGHFGAGAVVAVVDTGVDLAHEDLANNAIPGISFLDCGEDGCGNGDWQSGPEDQRNGHMHGTHVAGTVAAEVNGIGVAGVAPEAAVLAVRVLNDAGSGTLDDVAMGIEWAADNGAHVINLSLGTSPDYHVTRHIDSDQRLIDAVEYASERGVLVVSSAGNDFASICGSPAFYAGGLCIASTRADEVPASYSNLVIKEDMLAVAAPGGEILGDCGEAIVSTVPTGTGGDELCGYPEGYDEAAGTSMAAPHVAGAAALLFSQGCTREEVIDLLTQTARTPGPIAVRGVWDPVYGYGIVDVEAAFALMEDEGACAGEAPTLASTGDMAATTLRSQPVAIDLAEVLPVGGRVVAPGTPGSGAAERVDDTTILYTPERTFHGTDTFTYSALDADGAVGVGTITVDVAFAPLPPDTTVNLAIVGQDPVTVDAAANDRSLDGGELAVVDVLPARLGATDLADGRVTFTPGEEWTAESADAFAYVVRDDSGGMLSAGRVIVVGPGCLTDFFDDLDPEPHPDWETDLAANSNVETVSWQPTPDPLAAGGTQSWFSEAFGRDYKDDRLVSPPQWITTSTVLRFEHRFFFELGGYDGGVLEISVDDGASWEPIGPELFLEGGYNGEIHPDYGNPVAGRPAWVDSSSGLAPTQMVPVAVDLSGFAGHEARVRWRLAMDPMFLDSLLGAGWWVDGVAFDDVVADECLDPLLNASPIAGDDVATASSGEATRIDVLGNDEDPDGDPLQVARAYAPVHGSATIVEDGAAVSYTSAAGFTGTDTFTYVVSDGRGGADLATVTVEVTGGDDDGGETCERPGRGRGNGPADGRCPGGPNGPGAGPGDGPGRGDGPPGHAGGPQAGTADEPGLFGRLVALLRRLFGIG